MDEILFYEKAKSQIILGDDHYTLREISKKPRLPVRSKAKVILRTLCICVAFLILGVGLGFWTCRLKNTFATKKITVRNTKPERNHQDIVSEINSEEIEKRLREFTRLPHNAGSKRNHKLAEYIKQKWQNEYGIKTTMMRYKVLLSFPSLTKRSSVSLVTSEGEVMFKTQTKEKPVEVSEKQEKVLPPFAAYSSSGNVTGDIIYVNYGRIEDFQYLAKKNMSCEGKIAIVRYGENFRGDKVNLAYVYGAVGVVVYSDPADVSPDPTRENYPESRNLPCSGVQRGSFRTTYGDPGTPGYPAKDGIYRVSKDKRELTKIPVYPISACDAQEILRKLKKVVSILDAWKGGLNISYNIGPGFEKPYDTWKIRLEVYNEEREEDIYNVVATIKGKHEPDRRVIIGNHRDAWVFGGVDPSGGTACLMEIARTLGRALRNGWQPHRTIILCSWGGEEYGMIGSTEYVEEFSKTLREESVAYLNIDSPVRGAYSLYAKSSPMLFDVFFQATQKVKNPTNENETVYQQWIKNLPSADSHCHLPRVDKIAIGSDYVAFNQQLGIPSAEIRYIASKNNLGYPVYHSLHDTFNYVKIFIDPEFLIHRAVAQVMLHSMLSLADLKVLPMNASRYSEILTKGVKKLGENYRRTLEENNISLKYLEKAVEKFVSATISLQNKVENVDKQDDLKLRVLNDKIISLEKGFINNVGLEGRTEIRHVIFGLNATNSYKTVEFPGLSNVLMLEPKNKGDIQKQINIIITHIRSVASYLEDD